jgi:hypothetical protein
MAWSFGDGFDLYAAPADALNGYWDSGVAGSFTLAAGGRFTGSQRVTLGGNASPVLIKSSGANDAVHHVVLAYFQTSAISGSTINAFVQLQDAGTAQCTIVFRSDGAILLTSTNQAGATLATYTGAFTVQNTWYAFEMEVVINNTTGRFRVRKNGNNVDDFDSGAVLNTRGGTANNYANRIGISGGSAGNIDDLFWRSDASSVAWMGDIRCYTRMPASDATVQFSRSPNPYLQATTTAATTVAVTAGRAQYAGFVAAYDGTISTATVTMTAGYTGNMKCSIFAATALGATGQPAAVLGSATSIVNPVTGANTFTFGTSIAVTKGVQYFIGFCSDTTSGTYTSGGGTPTWFTTTAYASFPVASPGSPTSSTMILCTLTIATAGNFTVVNEAQQDTTTSYVYDSTPGDADFYGIATIASTPVSTFMVTTRGYMEKSDAGTRTAAVQLKSGSATVASTTAVLTTSGWQWVWRSDLTDPNTSAAWTAAAVNNVTIGPTVIA